MINNWITSSYTQPNDTCVEMGYDDKGPEPERATWGLGDTKDPVKRRLYFNGHRPVAGFVAAAKTGTWIPA